MSNKEGIIKPLHKRQQDTEIVESNEGQPSLLCSNKELSGCPSLDIKNNFETEEAAIDYLASILVKGFLEMKRNENNCK